MVTYGRSAGPDYLSRVSRKFSKYDSDYTATPGDRDVQIAAKSIRGFSLDPKRPYYPQSVFAEVEGEESFDAVLANGNQPFERVHFAGSADEVSELVDTITGKDKRIRADHSAIQALRVPSMVAYGDEAVVEATRQISKVSPRQYEFLARRCLEGLGVAPSALGTLPEVEDERMMSNFGNHLFRMFDEALDDFLEKSNGLDSRHARTLAFFGPLQDAIGYHPSQVMRKIKVNNPAMYSHDAGHVVTEDHFVSNSVLRQIRTPITRLKELGVRGLSKDSAIIEEANGIEKEALETALRRTSALRFMTRNKINKRIKSLATFDEADY